MGERGPVPKRSSQRRRRNKPEDGVEVDQAQGAAKVPVPKANSKWHPIAKRWFEALAASGQSHFYEPSDWATAELLAEAISRELRPKVVGITEAGDPVKAETAITGSALQALLKGMSSLLVTEGDRRRARVELERPKPESEGGGGGVAWLDDARRRRGAS